ncbi:MAG: IS5 family transposase [Thermoplasmata archaeon]|nr:MAG: IS5 family transposase [Thermoplasmata archaeon]
MKKKRWGKKYVDKRNWKEYNKKLVKRGEAYISLDFIETWKKELEEMNKGKEGAPYQYPETLMIFLGYIYVLLGIDYRGLQGYLLGLSKLVPFEVPHYSTIYRRISKLKIDLEKTLLKYKGKDVIISLDSTGVKVTNRGEWIRHKWKVRRGWIKVHIAVDDKNKQVTAISVTNEEIHDNAKFGELLENSIKNVEAKGGKIIQANADAAYDSNESFMKAEKFGIIPAIKVRKPPPTARSKNPRKKYAKEYHGLGYEKWRDKYGYGKRWYSEIPHSVVKRKCGEFVRASKKENMYHEAKLKYIFYNSMIIYDETGIPIWKK